MPVTDAGATWTRLDRGYSRRVKALRGNISGLNGSVRINNGTAFDDGNVDFMTGSAGTDWFLNGSGFGVEDKLLDLKANEIVTPLELPSA